MTDVVNDLRWALLSSVIARRPQADVAIRTLCRQSFSAVTSLFERLRQTGSCWFQPIIEKNC